LISEESYTKLEKQTSLKNMEKTVIQF